MIPERLSAWHVGIRGSQLLLLAFFGWNVQNAQGSAEPSLGRISRSDCTGAAHVAAACSTSLKMGTAALIAGGCKMPAKPVKGEKL